MAPGPLDSVRRPEYTGENRCPPCTVVNGAIVVAAAVGLWYLSRALAVAVLLGGLALVYLRGYVVPYTPRFAPRLVEAIPGDVGPDHRDLDRDAGAISDGAVGGVDDANDGDGDDDDSDPERDAHADRRDSPDPGGEAVLDALVDEGVVHEGGGENGDGLRLDDAFRDEWRDLMGDLDDPAAAVRDLRRDAHRVDTYEDAEGAYVVVENEPDAPETEVWLPRTMAVADAAAARVLEARGVGRETALAAAPALRRFLDRCPECGGDLAAMQQREACCGGFGPSGPDRVLACTDCEATVARLE